MADNQEERSTEDLSEQESPYRLEEYRRKGQVSQSKELSGLAALIAASATLYVMAPTMSGALMEFMRELFRTDLAAQANLGHGNFLGNLLLKTLKVSVLIVLPIAAAGFILGALGSFAQIGSIFSTEPLNPDLNRLDPMKGIKRIFSLKHLLESFRMMIKMTVICLVAYTIIKSEVLDSSRHLLMEPVNLIHSMGKVGAWVLFPMLGIIAVFGGFDWWLNRWEYGKSLRLTKKEAKEEFKEREGDPQIKARVRAIQREAARRRMMAAVKKADVIVTNPTHIAIAIVYDKEKMQAPRVVAKGADFMAQKIKKVAAEAGVPLVENVPLARTLYKTVKLGQAIPRQLYQAVAEVLAYVYRLKNRNL